MSQGAAPKASTDPLNRTDPRSTVTAFLETCHSNDYVRAAQYLDLSQIPQNSRATAGPQLARRLEAILNSDGRFDVLRLSQSPEGDPSDDANPSIEHIASISRNGKTFTVDLERVSPNPPAQVWLFAPSTVKNLPALTPPRTGSAIEARLLRFLVSFAVLETPIWKWVVLLIFAILAILLFRLMATLIVRAIGRLADRFQTARRAAWIQALVEPWLVFLAAIAFGAVEQIIDPSALSRLYIGRAILLVVVWAFAWCLINLVDLFLARIDSFLDPRQRMVSHSLIYLGRRTSKVIIVALALIVVLDNWGYNMTTIIAGLGVGGIAVALAAQNTIANVFGGVSVIGDHPVMVGDFGNFGGVIGTVEDIGMRSTRVRTLNRTIMSIPNSAFAAMNLENYELRDKILFNPTLQVKRGAPKEKIHQTIESLENMLKNDKRIEVGSSPIRLTNLTAASFALEIFAYALTSDINEYYKIQASLFLAIDEVFTSAGVELA